MEKCKKIKLEYDDPNVYQVTARYLHVEGGRYVLELVQKLDDDMMIDAESGEKLANRLSSYEDKLYHDALTGTLNRRYYEEHMCKTVYEAGIAMIDVDNFKLYNDVFGHRAGDVVLETMAQSVKLLILLLRRLRQHHLRHNHVRARFRLIHHAGHPAPRQFPAGGRCPSRRRC